MGVVWLAHSLALDVDVAVKVVPRRGDRLAIAKRLAKEARVAARFGHPAIVRVFDSGRTRDGDPFLVMELLEGESLASLLERESRLSALRAGQMLLPIADALATAHDRGIVHRDLKPDNIFLCRDSIGRTQPKLLDFGIVKMMDDDELKLTTVGLAVGSAEYMSPEQARGSGDVDPRTDVWSFCVVLYELVTGRVPFEGENYNSVMRAIIEDEPRSVVDLHSGDPELSRILSRGLTKEREQRWQSMREVGEALAAWLCDHGVEEDICAASLRKTWNIAGPGLTGMEVVSHDREPGENCSATASLPYGHGVPPRPTVPDAPTGKRSGRWLVPPLMVGALLLVGLGSWAVDRAGPDDARASTDGRNGSLTSASAPDARLSVPVAPMPRERAAHVAQAPADPDRSPEVSPQPIDPGAARAHRAPALAHRRKRPGQQAATPKPAPRHPRAPVSGNLDFGF